MKIFLTGAAGQLGRELTPLLRDLGDVTATDREDDPSGEGRWAALDLASAEELETALDAAQPDLIVNCGAWTAVDQAEDAPEASRAVNAAAPGLMARWAAGRDSALVHYSTDYVFDGRLQRAYREDDAPAPLNEYGAGKLAGERAIAASGCRHLVLRSAWIYASHGANFVLKMLELARQGRELSVVGDQVGSPTWAANLARYTIAAVRAGLPARAGEGQGIYHCADRAAVSWFELARAVFEIAVERGLLERMPVLRETDSAGFPQRARRPARSVLDCSAFEAAAGIETADLRASLAACLGQLENNA